MTTKDKAEKTLLGHRVQSPGQHWNSAPRPTHTECPCVCVGGCPLHRSSQVTDSKHSSSFLPIGKDLAPDTLWTLQKIPPSKKSILDDAFTISTENSWIHISLYVAYSHYNSSLVPSLYSGCCHYVLTDKPLSPHPSPAQAPPAMTFRSIFFAINHIATILCIYVKYGMYCGDTVPCFSFREKKAEIKCKIKSHWAPFTL